MSQAVNELVNMDETTDINTGSDNLKEDNKDMSRQKRAKNNAAKEKVKSETAGKGITYLFYSDGGKC